MVQKYLPSFPYIKLFKKKKLFSKNTIILTLMTSGVYANKLTSNLSLKNVITLPGPFQSYLMLFADLSYYIVFEILTIIWRNMLLFGKVELW